MDALVLDAPGKMPTSLNEKPKQGLKAVKAVSMLSPWCKGDVMGFNIIKAVHEDFAKQVPILAVIPTRDQESNITLCKEILERNKNNGVIVEIYLIEGAGHTFAQPMDDYGNPFPDYNPKLAKKAFDRIYNFFNKYLKN